MNRTTGKQDKKRCHRLSHEESFDVVVVVVLSQVRKKEKYFYNKKALFLWPNVTFKRKKGSQKKTVFIFCRLDRGLSMKINKEIECTIGLLT